MDTDLDELEALVVGFLQQGLKENPNGVSINEFQRSFHVKCDEPANWYQRYGKRNVIEALECIPNAVKLVHNQRMGVTFITLNSKSDKIDTHLIDLITNQKSSVKKKSSYSRPSSRALLSFSLNRQYSNHNRRPTGYSNRLNYDQQYRSSDNYNRRQKDSSPAPAYNSSSSFTPSIYQQKQPLGYAQKNSLDPRLRGSSMAAPKQSTIHPPPQVQSKSLAQNHISSASKPLSASSKPVTYSTSSSSTGGDKISLPRPKSSRLDSSASADVAPTKPSKEESTVLVSKKHHLRQRICSLLSRKYSEIKLLHLASLYQLEFEESIDSEALGYPNITSLLQDPLILPYIQINYKAPFVTVTAKTHPLTNGKDNSENSRISSSSSSSSNNENMRPVEATNGISRTKLEAIDRFNTKSMVQSLEKLPPLREPTQSIEIEDPVKFKTMRIIFRSQDMTLKIDDWPDKFNQETKLRIRIRDYGFKTLLEFFKKLASELPIKLKLNEKSEWVAIAMMAVLSDWLYDMMNKGMYRAMTAIDGHYELVAFPNDHYTFTPAKELEGLNYMPAFILTVKRSTSMWIQLRTPKKIEGHLCIEASMTCYEDYKSRDLLTVPQAFIRPGFPCAVLDPGQQRWCRGLVLKAPERVDKNCEVTVLLVDYGVTRCFVASQLLCLMKTHLKIPVGPIYSKLAGVLKEESLDTQHRAKYILHEYTNPPVTLACKFLRSIPSPRDTASYLPKICFEVSLVDTRSGKDCNITEDINRPRDSD